MRSGRVSAKKRRGGALPIGLVVAVALGVTLAGTGVGVTGAAPGPHVLASHGLEAWTSASAVDWVTYGDHLVEVRVESGLRLEPSAAEVSAGEGLAIRQVTVSVSRVLWSNDEAPEIPAELTFVYGGWAFDDTGERRFTLGGPWLEVGEPYLMQVAHMDDAATEWAPIGSDAVLSFAKGTIGGGEEIESEHASPRSPWDSETVRAKVWGEPGVATLVDLLTAAAPHPAAVGVMDRTPFERAKAVAAVS